MWLSEAKIMVGYLLTAAFQILWHWLLSRDHELAQSLLGFYLSYDPKVGKGVAGWFDLVLPCVCLGLLTGFVGWNWSVRKLAWFVALIAVGLVALEPAYPHLLNQDQVWWWPKTNRDVVIFIAQQLIKAVLMLGMLAYGGRCFGAYFHREAH